MHKYLVIKIFLCVILLSAFAGCNQKKETDNKTAKGNTPFTRVSTNSFSQSAAMQAKKQVLAMEGIIDAKAINTDKELYLSVKPAHYKRFQLKKLKKEIAQKLQQSHPNMKSYVSTDSKISMLLEKLENRIERGDADKDTIQKQIKKIKTEMNSDT